jgi:hypothetical protein
MEVKAIVIDCPKLKREAKTTYGGKYVTFTYGYYDEVYAEDIEVYLDCECGENHTWTLPIW